MQMSDNSIANTISDTNDEKNTYMYQYDFSCLNDKDFYSKLNDLGLIQHKWNKYFVLKYDKKRLQVHDYKTKGLFRSVIHSNGSILAISPPKSIDFNEFLQNYPARECVMDELVEGTMINLFYDHETEQWEMATKSTIGANSYFFKEYDVKELGNGNGPTTLKTTDSEQKQKQSTFRELFLDICQEVKLKFDDLPKKYCYSFVFQHPSNRIVVPITRKRLYLISVFQVCNGNIVKGIDKYSTECREIFEKTNVTYPTKYYINTYNECLDFQKGLQHDHETVGLSILHTKSGMRTKLRNHVYEYVRRLRGNQPKLEYRFLELLRERRLNEYLSFYPEKRDEMNAYKNKHFTFTNQLYSNYISCYIKHERELKEFPTQFKKHMFDLHQLYKFTLKPNGLVVNKKVVIDYVNNLHPSVLMYSMNLHLRILKRPTKTKTNESVKDTDNLVKE